MTTLALVSIVQILTCQTIGEDLFRIARHHSGRACNSLESFITLAFARSGINKMGIFFTCVTEVSVLTGVTKVLTS